MNLFFIMLVNNKYMDIFPTSFAFFFWNKTLSDCRVFLKWEKKIGKKNQGTFLFSHPSSSLDQIILWSFFGLMKGAVFAVLTG